LYWNSEYGIAEKYKSTPSFETRLFPIRPNPFARFPLTIAYSVGRTGPQEASICIYDILGRKVHSLMSSRLMPGFYQVVWDGGDDSGRTVPAGVYFVRLAVSSVGKTTDKCMIKKVVKLR
jgi:hypothetical protein